MKITVIGSINMDVVNKVQSHPQPGETIHGLGTSYSPGGKGANQAVAAAKSGASVSMIGAVGDDGFANQLEAALTDAGVLVDCLSVKEGTSGLAFITVNALGENNIILSAGANGELEALDVARHHRSIDGADIILLQNEIPWDATSEAIHIAARQGVRVYLNPAPAVEIDQETLASVDTLFVNETEAETLTSIKVTSVEQGKAACLRLLNDGVRAVVLTLGGNGSLYMDAAGTDISVPAYPVTVVDTTAAGDTFIGAFASQPTDNLEQALHYAAAAAALTVSRPGAQASIPTREEVLHFLASVGQ